MSQLQKHLWHVLMGTTAVCLLPQWLEAMPHLENTYNFIHLKITLRPQKGNRCTFSCTVFQFGGLPLNGHFFTADILIARNVGKSYNSSVSFRCPNTSYQSTILHYVGVKEQEKLNVIQPSIALLKLCFSCSWHVKMSAVNKVKKKVSLKFKITAKRVIRYRDHFSMFNNS